MTTTVMAGSRYGRAFAAALILSSPIPTAGAVGWTVTTDITVRETYNDNANYAFTGLGDEREDFITEVRPGLRISGSGPRLRAHFDYRPSLLYYAHGSQEDRLFNNLSAFGDLEVLDNFFFVEATGNISQEFISPFGARPADITIGTPNRIETRTLSLTPYIRGVFGQGYNYELRNRNVWTTSNNDRLSNVTSTYWTGRVASPVQRTGWALEYEDSKIRQEDFTLQPDRESRLVRGRLFFQPDYAWRFSASAGWEENNYELLREMQSNSIYGVGVAWNPSPRTSAEAQYEERYFGPSRLARLQHRTRLTAWSLNYSLNTSNFQEELLRLPPGNTAALVDAIFAARIPDPAERRAAVEQFLSSSGTPSFLSSSLAFYTTQIFLEERLEASVAIMGVRNSIWFSVWVSESERIFSEDLRGIVPDTFLPSDRIRQRGFGVRANHRLAAFTSAGLSATRAYSQQLEPSIFETWNDNISLTLNHTLSPRTTTFAGVGYTETENKDVFTSNQKSRSVFVGLNHRF
jgi:uncharacterized protein (PEP-CTERM system associated)